jgi:Spy/CpxP family protein refolding chaperone
MRLAKLLGLASITAAAFAFAASAHADVDTDFADQLHGYGICGPRDYHAWLGKMAILAGAIGRYCPDQTPVLTSAARPR